jgi:hypothetical protein
MVSMYHWGRILRHGIMRTQPVIRRNLPLADLLNVGIVGENVQGALGMIIVRAFTVLIRLTSLDLDVIASLLWNLA